MVTVNNSKNNQTNAVYFELSGLSSDTKPTEIDGFPVGENSLFLELDTGDFYYFNGSSWAKIGE